MKTQPPKITKEHRYGDDRTIYEHPAFGQVEVSRVSGYVPLYASDFKHQHFIAIRVHHSKMERSLSRDWHFTDRIPIVEFYLSEHQWAAFVSSVGIGGGVPCTIRQTEKDGGIPGLEHRDEAHDYSDEVKERLFRATEGVRAALREVDEMNLPKAKAARLKRGIEVALRNIEENIPFVAKSFDEHMETRVEKAKSEIAAHMQNAVMRAVIAALKNEPPILIEDESSP
jgi:hypothetical protein